MNKKTIFLAICAGFVIICMVLSPMRFALAALSGMTVAMTAVVPALFPFIFFTKLLLSAGADKALAGSLKKPMQRLFGVQGEASFVFVISLLSGYPVGAKSIYDLSETTQLSKTQAHRMTAFCSNSGPMFLVGTVGGMFLKSTIAGVIVLVAHLFGSVCNGLIFRRFTPPNGHQLVQGQQQKAPDHSLQGIMFSSVAASLNICGFIALFFVLCELLLFLQIDKAVLMPLAQFLRLDANIIKAMVFGAIEVTRGCFEVANSNLTMQTKTVLCTLLASFGGMSIAFQSLSYLLKVKVSALFYFLSKLVHALLAALIAWGLATLLLK